MTAAAAEPFLRAVDSGLQDQPRDGRRDRFATDGWAGRLWRAASVAPDTAAVRGRLRRAAHTLAIGTAPSHWRTSPSVLRPGKGMSMRRVIAQLAVVALLLAGCATGAPASPPAPSQPPDAASSPAPSASPTQSPGSSPSPTAGGSALVYGEITCERTSWTSRMEDDNEILLEHFSCRYSMSDPRLDGGQFEADVTTTIEPGDAPAARWEATTTITNQGGSWSGPARGAVVFWDTGEPWNYWEASFAGSGAYEGLVYHELGAGSNAVATVTGSIEPAE